MFLIRATQLLPHARFNDFEKSATASLSAHGTYATAFKVRACPARTLNSEHNSHKPYAQTCSAEPRLRLRARDPGRNHV